MLNGPQVVIIVQQETSRRLTPTTNTPPPPPPRPPPSTTGNITAVNPNNTGASVSLSWLNDIGRLRIGGVGTGAANGFEIQTINDVSLMRILDNGNVGIGTATPLTKLHIKDLNNAPIFNITGKTVGTGGDALISEIRLSNLYDNLSGHRASIKAVSDKSGSHGNVAFQFNTSIWNGQHTEIEAMRVSSNGNVGIGTTSPDSKLTVKGKIHAEEVKVDLSVPGPDYVFASDYKLPSLEELQQYIEKNKHLPNIPSAKEMEANGVELGVMNMKLLEKIEELVLYVIELKKENEVQQTMIEKKDIEIKKTKKMYLEHETRLQKIEKLLNTDIK